MSPNPLALRAGPWRLTLTPDGAISQVSVYGIEVLHSLMIVVRDDAWGTVPGPVNVSSADANEHGFTVELRAAHVGGNVRFDWHGTLTGTEARVTIEFEGLARQRFESNRIGFVALHPLSYAGREVTIVHPDRSTSSSSYPVAVAPHQPFMNVAAFRQAIDQGTVSVEFEGDVFETEDQRNWSDASYKTYSRPLALPFPVVFNEGETVHQKVRLGFEPNSLRAAKCVPLEQSSEVTEVRLGELAPLPSVGLTVGPDDHVGALAAEIALLAPDFLRIDLVLGDELRGADALRDALASSRLPLQLALHVGSSPEASLTELRDLLDGNGDRLASIAVFDAEAPVTTQRAMSAVVLTLGDLIAGVAVIVGTDDNLAELNRNPVFLAEFGAAAVTFSLNPGVHDLRAVSILETPDALPAMVQTAQALAGGPLVLGPLTLRPRRNLYRAGARIDRLARDAAATDERQDTGFAAAWLIATVGAAVASGVEAVTLFEICGPRGLVAAPGGARYPLFDVVAELGAAKQAMCCSIGRPSDVAALALADDAGVVTTLLLANRTDAVQTILLPETGERRVLAAFGIEIVPRNIDSMKKVTQ